jgi:hypothetical protein
MVPDAEVAARHLDALALRALDLAAALPGDDAIGPAVDRRRGDRQRGRELAPHLLLVRQRAALGAPAEEAGDVDGVDVAERARERDHQAHRLREAPSQLARVDAAQAPADEAHAPAVAPVEVAEPRDHRRRPLGRRPQVAPQVPAVGAVPPPAQEAAHRAGREVARAEAGEDQDRMAVAPRRAVEHRQRGHDAGQLEEGTPLEPEEVAGGRRDARGGVHGERLGGAAPAVKSSAARWRRTRGFGHNAPRRAAPGWRNWQTPRA